MQFKFYDDPDDNGWGETGSAFGYAAEDIGPEKTFGFRVDFDDIQAAQGWVDFTIPELRQMLAEAQELAVKDGLANCDCGGCNYAPLADEEELAQDFEDRSYTPLELTIDSQGRVCEVAGGPQESDPLSPKRLLDSAREALAEGDGGLAQRYIDLAYAAKSLL